MPYHYRNRRAVWPDPQPNFLEIAGEQTQCPANPRMHVFVEHFGACATLCFILWLHLIRLHLLPQNAKPVYLLWALYFMKTYPTENVGAGFCCCGSINTYKKWTKAMIEAIARMKLVSYHQSMLL